MVLNKGRCAWATAVGLAMSIALGGCSGSNELNSTPRPSAPNSSVSVTPTPTPSPMPTPSTASEKAAADGVVAYLRVVDKLGIDPESDLNELNTVATGQALAQMQHNLMQYRIEGWRQTGEQVPTFVGSTAGSSAKEWSITMCIDVSGVDVVDLDGQSVKNPDGVPRLLTEFLVQQGLTDIWYVAQDEVTATC